MGVERRLVLQVAVTATALIGAAISEWVGAGLGFADWQGYVVLYAAVCFAPALFARRSGLFVAAEIALALLLTGYGLLDYGISRACDLLPGAFVAWIAAIAMNSQRTQADVGDSQLNRQAP